MKLSGHLIREGVRWGLLFILPLVFVLWAAPVLAQASINASVSPVFPNFPDFASLVQEGLPENQQLHESETTSTTGNKNETPAKPGEQGTPPPNPQPQRILGVMPNFRAVSAGQIPPPPTMKEAFVIATQNSFDYSAFIFVGVTSLLAEGTNVHTELGKGVPGFGRYYWRGLLDKTDGNYLVIFALPTVFHQDERYYAKGQGGIWKRAIYAASRVIITPDYQGHSSFNASELLGRGMAQAISIAYYPSQTRTFGGIASKFGYAIGRDALTNTFREFWPDIAVHVLHRHP